MEKTIEFYHNEKVTLTEDKAMNRVYIKVEGLGTFAMPKDAAFLLGDTLKEISREQDTFGLD